MKVIFLDIDGVLNSFDNMYALNSFWKEDPSYKSRDDFGHLFDERCVTWLRYIINKTNAKIVISSTWRMSGLIVMKELWKYRNLPGEVIDITSTSIDPKLIELYANENSHARGYQIQEWLNNNEHTNYCIIDDDSDMLDHQKFVHVKGRYGLTYESSKQIIKILND